MIESMNVSTAGVRLCVCVADSFAAAGCRATILRIFARRSAGVNDLAFSLYPQIFTRPDASLTLTSNWEWPLSMNERSTQQPHWSIREEKVGRWEEAGAIYVHFVIVKRLCLVVHIYTRMLFIACSFVTGCCLWQLLSIVYRLRSSTLWQIMDDSDRLIMTMMITTIVIAIIIVTIPSTYQTPADIRRHMLSAFENGLYNKALLLCKVSFSAQVRCSQVKIVSSCHRSKKKINWNLNRIQFSPSHNIANLYYLDVFCQYPHLA